MAKKEIDPTPLEVTEVFADRLPAWSSSVARQLLENVINDGGVKKLDELKLKKTKSSKARGGEEVKLEDLQEVAPVFAATLLNAISLHISAKVNMKNNIGAGTISHKPIPFIQRMKNKWQGIMCRRNLRRAIRAKVVK